MTTKRTFLKAALASGLAIDAIAVRGAGNPNPEQLITVIDLDKCDGCAGLPAPACVEACRNKNKNRFPEPQKPLQPYWPQSKYEDFSDDRENISRLTPYNWIYVQHVKAVGREVHIPRRCMHCLDAPCRKLCPFGAIDQSRQGAVQINEHVCFGGAKCRDVCPWGIPQRQAGVGIYLKAEPKLAGGGVMYKCDFCADLIARDEEPVCVSACPRSAMKTLPLDKAEKLIESLGKGRHVYGRKENGGTATWYLSSVSFDEIHRGLRNELPPSHPGRPLMGDADARLNQSKALALGTLAAPVIALGASIALRKRNRNQDK